MALDVYATRLVLLDRGTPPPPATTDSIGLVNLPGNERLGYQDEFGDLWSVPATPWLDTSSSDSSAALLEAMTNTAARGGGVVEIPAGPSYLGSQIDWPAGGVYLKGQGRGASRFILADGFDGFLFSDLRYGGIDKVSISALTQRTSGYAVKIEGGDSSVIIAGTAVAANEFEIGDVDMDNQCNGVLIANTLFGPWGVTIGGSKKLIWKGFKPGKDAIRVDSGSCASLIIQKIFFSNGMGAELGAAAIRVTGVADMQLLHCDMLGYANGFLLNNTAQLCDHGGALIQIIGCEFDNTGAASGADCIRLAPGNLGGGLNANITGNWMASGYNGVAYVGYSGATWKSEISGGNIAGCAQYGVRGTGGTTRDTGAGGNVKVDEASLAFELNGIADILF